mgnify:CR=1 FL=1
MAKAQACDWCEKVPDSYHIFMGYRLCLGTDCTQELRAAVLAASKAAHKKKAKDSKDE